MSAVVVVVLYCMVKNSGHSKASEDAVGKDRLESERFSCLTTKGMRITVGPQLPRTTNDDEERAAAYYHQVSIRTDSFILCQIITSR